MTRPLNVLYLMESMEVAGAEQLVLSIVRRIDRERFRPVIGCLTVPGPLAPDVAAAGVDLVALGKRAGFDLSILGKLERLMGERAIDIVHTHVWNADVWGRVAARMARVPVAITTEHNVDNWKRRRHFVVDRFLSRWSVKIACVSRAVLEFYRDQVGIPAERLELVYNGIDPAPFLAPIDVARKRAELDAAPGRFVLTVVGRLVPQKTQHFFLEALKRVRERHPRALGFLAGGGPLETELREKARALGLGPDAFRLLGERRDVPEVLLASDAFVLPTAVREGLSLSVLEGMAAALPVIATDIGGNRETIEDGKSGYLVPPGDPEALAGAMGRVIDEPERARAIGQAGRAVMLERFTLDGMVRAYERLYGEAWLNAPAGANPPPPTAAAPR